jgi:hypothetical protein
MRRAVDIWLIVGFLAVDFSFHDILKTGEVITLPIHDRLPEHRGLCDLHSVGAEVPPLDRLSATATILRGYSGNKRSRSLPS